MIEYVVVYPFAVERTASRLPLVLKHKSHFLAGMLNLPGGKLEPGESPVMAAVRELKEETGLDEIQEYDGMCYYPAERLGTIKGTKSLIHCVRVPISARQELKPGADEVEDIRWYPFPDLFDLPNLMPNLRLVIPLMSKGVKGWQILDVMDTWRMTPKHRVGLMFDDTPNNVIDVCVNSVKAFDDEEEG